MENKITYEYEGIIIEVEGKQDLSNDSDKRKSAYLCRAIRNQTGMNRKDFAVWLDIPYRTIQDWELGVSQVPEYLLKLIAYKVRMENAIKKGELVYVNK